MAGSEVTGIAVGGAIGALIGGIYAYNPGNLPSSIDIGATLKSPLVWGLIGLYYILSIFLLWLFFKPERINQILSVIGGGILWGTF